MTDVWLIGITVGIGVAAGIEPGEDEQGRTVVTDPSGNHAVLATRSEA